MKERIWNNFMKFQISNLLGMFALAVATVAANRCCIIIYHEPPIPDKVKQLRKF